MVSSPFHLTRLYHYLTLYNNIKQKKTKSQAKDKNLKVTEIFGKFIRGSGFGVQATKDS